MHSSKELQKLIIKRIEDLNLIKDPLELYSPIEYTLNLGGKRVRPVLCLMGCDLFGGSIDEAIYPAIALEIFHNFTLIHDDIMDNAPIRRGYPTVFKKWNPNIAILSGDAMMALAYDFLVRTKFGELRPIIKEFNKLAIEVCEGQQFDLNYETEGVVSISDYMNMIYLKTSVLLAGSLKIGAIIGGATIEDSEMIYKFGIHIGFAFQLKDDLLDIFSNERDFGKKKGGDILTNKKTFLYLKALELANENQHKELKELYNGLVSVSDEEKIERVKNIYLILKIKEVTINEIHKNMKKALKAMDHIQLSENRKQHLINFALDLTEREI